MFGAFRAFRAFPTQGGEVVPPATRCERIAEPRPRPCRKRAYFHEHGGYEAQRREMGLQAIKSTTEGQAPSYPGLRRATPETIDDVLDLHRRVAAL